jgi:hypothetical protein
MIRRELSQIFNGRFVVAVGGQLKVPNKATGRDKR